MFVDSREKRPLPIPAHVVFRNPTNPDLRETVRVHTQTKELKTGDYALAGCEAARLIERKGGVREVTQNVLTGDLKRFAAALDRLATACALPLLFIEGHPSELLSEQPWCKYPDAAMDTLMRMCDDRRITLEVVPCATMIQRRAAGEWLVRRLVNGSLSHYARCPVQPVPSTAVTPPVAV